MKKIVMLTLTILIAISLFASSIDLGLERDINFLNPIDLMQRNEMKEVPSLSQQRFDAGLMLASNGVWLNSLA